MKVRMHNAVAMGHGREEALELLTTPPHVYFDEDGRAELRWSAADNLAHTHNRVVRLDIPKPQADALRAMVARATRRAFGQAEEEPPAPPAPAPAAEDLASWAPPETPRQDGKPWTPPGIEPEPLEEEKSSS